MFAKPQKEHQWLDQLIGTWSFEHACQTPDGTASNTTGTMTCRSLDGMWLICESTGGSPEEPWSSIMTLGFDIAQNKYVGTFIGTMMSFIWHYVGELDAAGKKLPLVSEGPTFDGSGRCRYRDTVEIVDSNTWLFRSELEDQGSWVQFMNGTHTRILEK